MQFSALRLEESPDRSLRFVPYYVQSKLDWDAPFHGILLTPEDREQLLKTGNAGRVIELETLPLDKVSIPQRIRETDLGRQQRSELGEGKKVLVEGMTSRNGFKFDAYLQINAARNAFDFTYDGLDKNRYREDKKMEKTQTREQEGYRSAFLDCLSIRFYQSLKNPCREQKNKKRAGRTVLFRFVPQILP
jgi:hypothetical protein